MEELGKIVRWKGQLEDLRGGLSWKSWVEELGGRVRWKGQVADRVEEPDDLCGIEVDVTTVAGARQDVEGVWSQNTECHDGVGVRVQLMPQPRLLVPLSFFTYLYFYILHSVMLNFACLLFALVFFLVIPVE